MTKSSTGLRLLGLFTLATFAATLHGGIAAADDALPEPVAEADANSLFRTGELSEDAYDIPGQIVIDARDDLDTSGVAKLAAELGLAFKPTALEASTRTEIAEVPSGRIAEIIARLKGDSRVEIVEPLARVRALYTPNDPLYKDQWHMDRVRAPRAWDFSTGRGVTVAVIDTGIACEDHGPYMKGTDLAATECVGGWNFVKNNEHANDDQGHGTHVAGTIAQSTNNKHGAAGLAFHAKLMPIKVLNESGWGTTADIADGIRWAADHGAQVINMSLGGPRNSGVMQKAIRYAIDKGVTVVAAAGNTGGSVQYPGGCDGVIGVSATDSDDKIAKFSSRGKGIDIAAPGVNVVQQTICKKGRDKCEIFPGYNGTSMASPHVAGAAAMVVGLGVTDPVAVEAALRANARVIDSSDDGVKKFGAGILDAAKAAERITLTHALLRLFAVFALTLLVLRAARKENADAASPWRIGYWLPALFAGPGLFFFAPWILPRVDLVVDVLARPLGDLDLLWSAGIHRYLPLANALIPFGLTAVLFGVKPLRPVTAGLSVGIAGYLASAIVLNESYGPFGKVAFIAWCAGNALACLWIARTNLAETK